MTFEVRRYSAEDADCWNALVAQSKTGLFLFDRRFMDYHSDRFEDVSALVLRDGEPVAALAASRHGDEAVSHGGLTFGGLIARSDLRSPDVIDALDKALEGLRDWGVRKLTIKSIPAPFTTQPSGELDYHLWRRGFVLAGRDVSSIVPLRDPLSPSKAKLRDSKRAAKLGCEVRDTSLADFHPLLAEVLLARHGRDPVHSQDELVQLQAALPDRLLVRCAWLDGEPVAGTLLFRYGAVWHTQYLASNEAGRKANALDLVIASAMAEAASEGAEWFSFGISMSGDELNEGLLWQKESFGARTILFDRWTGDL